MPQTSPAMQGLAFVRLALTTPRSAAMPPITQLPSDQPQEKSPLYPGLLEPVLQPPTWHRVPMDSNAWSFLPSLLGAVVGGGISSLTAHKVLTSTQDAERKKRRTEAIVSAASQCLEAIVEGQAELLDEAGQHALLDEADDPATRRQAIAAEDKLRRRVAVASAVLRGTGAEDRVLKAVELLQTPGPDPLAASKLDVGDLARVNERLASERTVYIEYVIRSLQALVAEQELPPSTSPPRPVAEVDAKLWTPPDEGAGLSNPAKQRRQSARRRPNR